MEDKFIVDNRIFDRVEEIIQGARNRAIQAVNAELVIMYWRMGQYLSELSNGGQLNKEIVDMIVDYLHQSNINAKGFNRSGLFRMKRFYDLYSDENLVSTLLTLISWSHHLIIMSGSKSAEERQFYINLCVREHYSVRELKRQMDSAYYERYILSSGKKDNLDSVDKNVRKNILDSYVLEFLDLPTEYSEKDLQKAIVKNLKDFILEIGKDFTFVGEEYRIQVGGQDFYIDLLFYNRALKCLVAVELKLGAFKPEHIGQINFYLEALDRSVKRKDENPSVGIVLCASKDDAVVEVALSRSMAPTLVADYTLHLPDKKLLQNKLVELRSILESQSSILIPDPDPDSDSKL